MVEYVSFKANKIHILSGNYNIIEGKVASSNQTLIWKT